LQFVPGSGSAAASSAAVPGGVAGVATPIAITVRDGSGNAVAGATDDLAVTVTGANTAAPAVTGHGDGTYNASYTPLIAGVDTIAVTLAGDPVGGGPFTSVVAPDGISASVSTVTAAPTSVVA